VFCNNSLLIALHVKRKLTDSPSLQV